MSVCNSVGRLLDHHTLNLWVQPPVPWELGMEIRASIPASGRWEQDYQTASCTQPSIECEVCPRYMRTHFKTYVRVCVHVPVQVIISFA